MQLYFVLANLQERIMGCIGEKVQSYCSVSVIICHNHQTLYSSSVSLMITVTQGLLVSSLLSIRCNKEEGVIITFPIKLVHLLLDSSDLAAI